MRTVTTTSTIYSFDELPEVTQEKAIQNLYDINVDHDWWDLTFEDAKDYGLKIEGFDIDRGSYCKAQFTDDACYCSHKIIDNHGETCKTHKTATAFLKERDETVELAEKDENGEFVDEYELDQKLDEIESEFLKSISEDYRIILQNEYEYLTSLEAIKETIEANEYEFDENGKLV